MISLTCKQCQSSFEVLPYRKKTAKYCSKSCQCKGNRLPPPPRTKGSKHPQWKGGRRKNSQGYILIYSPNHPRKNKQNCVREHRLVVEKHIGRFITEGEVVHHKNHIRTDNRIENLQLLTKVEHDRLTNAERPKKKKLRKTCPYCQKVFFVYKCNARLKCCSQTCSTKMQWENGGKASFGR
jgi:hypothetical protein